MKDKEMIEEMARDIRPVLKNRVDIGFIPDLDEPIAKTLVKQGYRKVNKDECEYWKSRCKEIGDVAYEKARKETAVKIFNALKEKAKLNGVKNPLMGVRVTWQEINELAKQFGVEVEE